MTGCGNDPDPPETLEPNRTPSSAQTSTPTQDPELAAAEKAVSRYQKVTEDLWTNPNKSLNDIDTVAMDPASLQVKQQMQTARGNGMTGKGTLTYRDTTSQSVPGEDRATPYVTTPGRGYRGQGKLPGATSRDDIAARVPEARAQSADLSPNVVDHARVTSLPRPGRTV